MSVEELRSKITKLSVEIRIQKELLETLEEKKRSTETQLNSLVDPVARLPLELSSEIFMQCLPNRPKPDPFVAPMLLLSICHGWESIALSTPALWATIHLRSDHFTKISEIWLNRTLGRCLTVAI
ncbi:hypothetical protein C8R47DRAFT_982298, partial [Mycena vitilis]